MSSYRPGMTIDALEREAIEGAIEFYRNKEVAANALGITSRTIYKKLEKYKADDEEKNKRDAELKAREAEKMRILYPTQEIVLPRQQK